MSAQDLLRYGLRYAFVYLGGLALIFAGATVVAAFYEFRLSDLSIGALIAAAMLTYNRFLKRQGTASDLPRVPSARRDEHGHHLVVDFTLGALVIHFTRDYGLDGLVILIMIGIPLLMGVLGNMLFYAGFLGERTLNEIRSKQSWLDPTPVEPVDKMTFGDIGPFLLRYFAAYIPLYVLVQLLSVNTDIRGMEWLSFAVIFIAAICALAYLIRRLGRMPIRSEYWLLVAVSAVSAAVFEFVAEAAIDYYRFTGLPNFGRWFLYIMAAVILDGVIQAIAYSRPVAWLLRPRMRSVSDA